MSQAPERHEFQAELGDTISDLAIETWIVDPKKAVATTKKLETEAERPEATNEVGQLVDALKAAQIEAHAMALSRADHDKLSTKEGHADPLAMLALTKFRGKEATHRPWVALYGGAVHDDRFPEDGTAEWSYAESVDIVASGKLVQIDLIDPELAGADKLNHDQPWFPHVAVADRVLVWQRGERSLVMILPRTP